ncbi:GNAT family N-acetyltransferase [Streptomyces sp. AJS327]|nr:GNAT family N-acetyltransferase [Streptomyces sp. AJS327]
MLREVAEAVTLQEGPPGVRSVLRAMRQLTTASTKELSRSTGLPVPIAAAVGNELRRRGLFTRERPSRLTPSGLALVAELGMDLSLDATCAECDGRELVIPPTLSEAVERLTKLMEAGPGADMSLDQSRCTPETKVRRVLALARAGVLPGGSLLLVGDDDMVSLAVAVVSDLLGTPLVQRLTVVDISEEILGYIREVTADLAVSVETVQHDLREPLPERLRGQHDAAMTDPPYTAEGARLFLSRVVEGLRPGPANSVFFSFGAKNPNEMLEVQQEILNLGLVVNGFIRNFNEYEGSGTLGGTGFLQHLLTTSATQSSVGGSYQGPLYTRDKRSRQREYECVACGARVPVGPGARWSSVGALRAEGCPTCGRGPFRPRQLVSMAELPEPPAPARPPEAASGAPAPSDPAGSRLGEASASVGDGSRPAAVGQVGPAAPGEQDGPAPDAGRLAPGGAARRLPEQALLAVRSGPYVTRTAGEADLDAVADFEAEIARVSFGNAAVDNPQRHRARLARAMRKSREGMLVACLPEDATPVGWLWMTVNQNTMTGDRYANFRSLAVAPVESRSEVAELLVAAGLEFAAERDVVEVVGKTHIGNVSMRTLYRKFGFEAAHMTMKLRLTEGSGRDDDLADG